MKRPNLGDQELEVLRFIADNGPSTVGQVTEGFGAPRGLARSTILTVMERLRKKGFVGRKQQGGIFHYASVETQTDLMRDVVASFVRRSLSGSLSPFVTYLAEASEVSDDELAQLEETVARLQARRKREGNQE